MSNCRHLTRKRHASRRTSCEHPSRRRSRLERLEDRRLLAASLNPLSSIPELHSHASAPAALYLDFDGHFESVWGSYSDVTTPVYDVDSDPTTFSDAELANIVSIWERVSEDFAPYNLDVTTVEPAVLGDGVPVDQANGIAMRVSIGGDGSWFGDAGGTGYLDTFTNSVANTVYVFSDRRAGGQDRSVAEAASHEAGHGFGLRHQSTYDGNGNKVHEYNRGDQTWAPLMGAGAPNEVVVSTWHYGTSTEGASILQDDMAILAGATNGFGYRPDDHGNVIDDATPLAGAENVWTNTGIIETNDDTDVFEFSVEAGDTYRIRSEVADVGPNLDIVLALHGESGAIATADPSESSSAQITEFLEPGLYHVAVTKTSDYGRVGHYALTIDTPPAGVITQILSGATSSSEDGGTAQINVSLATKPESPVVIPIHSSDPTEGTLNVTSLTFTPNDWDSPQIVVATGVDDDLTDGRVAYSLVLGAASSDDPEYAGFDPKDVTIANADNDIEGWVETLGGTVISNARASIEVDSDENIYIFTIYEGTVDFDFGPGVNELSDSGGSTGGAAIAKYTRDRQLLWAKSFGGDGTERAKDIEVDADGNVYVTGRSNSSSIEFDAISIPTNGGDDAFVAKLDPQGEFLWAKTFGGETQDYGSDLAISSNGDVFIAGQFDSQADFDPDPDHEVLLTSAGGRDAIVWKLNGDGDFQWVRQFAGPGVNDQAYSIEVDAQGALYVTGPFSETINFGTTDAPILRTSQASGTDNSYLAKLDPSGETIWVREISSPGEVRSSAGIALDGNGSVYVGGSLIGTATFAGGPTLTGTTITDADAFISKWDTDGNVLWAQPINGDVKIRTHGIMADDAENVYLTGAFKGTVDFDPDNESTFPLTASPEFLDGYVVQLNGVGDFVAAYQSTGPNWVRGEEVAISDDGDIYAIGTHVETATLPTGDVVTSGIYRDTYILKLARAAGIEVSPTTGLITSETGEAASFHVVLDVAPAADVIIPLSTSDPGEGTVFPDSLLFTPMNWDIPQQVTVTGVDDVSQDGDVAYAIYTAPAMSDDEAYDGWDASDVAITNLDVEAPLFTDSFEAGEWNGLWIEDGQDDWFRSTQRATDGNHSAEVDGSANGATLTLADVLDLTPYGSANLEFSWFIESGFDAGEFLALDLFDGATWTEVASLRGNQDQENVWHQESILVSGRYLVDDFRFRFRSSVSRSNEDGNVDNVSLIATSLAGPPNRAPSITSIPVTTATEDEPYRYQVIATDPDVDDLLTYSLVVSPPGMSIDPTTGLIQWTPNDSGVGSNSISVRVADQAGAGESQEFNVQVANVNDAPMISSAPVTTATESTHYRYDVLVTDPDVNDGWIYSLPVSPGGMTIDSTTGIISWTPSSAQLGDHAVTVRVQDSGGLWDEQLFSLTVSQAAFTKFYVVDNSLDDMFEYSSAGDLQEVYSLHAGNTAPRGAAADETGRNVWVIDNDDYVYVYDTSGGLLRSWKALGLSRPEGIATDGVNLWIVDRGNDRVHFFAGGATRTINAGATSSFELVSNDPRGITTDGTHLWVVDAGTDNVYKYSLAGTFLGGWLLDPANTVPRGITIDPSGGNDIWVVDSTDDVIYEYADATLRTSGAQSASAVFNLAENNTDPQGIADPPDANLPQSQSSAREPVLALPRVNSSKPVSGQSDSSIAVELEVRSTAANPPRFRARFNEGFHFMNVAVEEIDAAHRDLGKATQLQTLDERWDLEHPGFELAQSPWH